MAAFSEGIINDTPQVLTGSWANLGVGEIETINYSFFSAYVELDINNSQGVQIRAVGEYEAGEGKEFIIPTKTIKKTIIELSEKPYQFEPDTDQNRIIEFAMDQTLKIIVIQVRALTVGVTPGQITQARYRQGYRQ